MHRVEEGNTYCQDKFVSAVPYLRSNVGDNEVSPYILSMYFWLLLLTFLIYSTIDSFANSGTSVNPSFSP